RLIRRQRWRRRDQFLGNSRGLSLATLVALLRKQAEAGQHCEQRNSEPHNSVATADIRPADGQKRDFAYSSPIQFPSGFIVTSVCARRSPPSWLWGGRAAGRSSNS